MPQEYTLSSHLDNAESKLEEFKNQELDKDASLIKFNSSKITSLDEVTKRKLRTRKMLRHQSIYINKNHNNFEREASPINNGDVLINLNKYNTNQVVSMRSMSVPRRFDSKFRKKTSVKIGDPEYLQFHLMELWDKNRKLLHAYNGEPKKFSKTPSK